MSERGVDFQHFSKACRMESLEIAVSVIECATARSFGNDIVELVIQEKLLVAQKGRDVRADVQTPLGARQYRVDAVHVVSRFVGPCTLIRQLTQRDMSAGISASRGYPSIFRRYDNVRYHDRSTDRVKRYRWPQRIRSMFKVTPHPICGSLSYHPPLSW